MIRDGRSQALVRQSFWVIAVSEGVGAKDSEWRMVVSRWVCPEAYRVSRGGSGDFIGVGPGPRTFGKEGGESRPKWERGARAGPDFSGSGVTWTRKRWFYG